MTPLERAKEAAKSANVNGSKYDLTDHYAEAIARAVLLAIREPSEAMCVSGTVPNAQGFAVNGATFTVLKLSEEEAGQVFTAMIDAALAETDATDTQPGSSRKDA